MKQELAVSFVLDALQHERGGVLVYATALQCVKHRDLKREWTKYHKQTKEHVVLLTKVCTELGVDPEHLTPVRDIVKSLGEALVTAMKHALAEADPATAELVACDCVVIAEAKDRANWELLGHVGAALPGEAGKTLRDAHEKVFAEEGEHLAHAQRWARELALKKLGIDAVLPREQEKASKPAIDAVRAEQAREETT